jgi:hypothetical protein
MKVGKEAISKEVSRQIRNEHQINRHATCSQVSTQHTKPYNLKFKIGDRHIPTNQTLENE